MASQEQVCRAVHQAVAEGGNERDVVRRVVGVLTNSVASQRSRAEGADRHRLQNLPGPLLGARCRSNGRGRSALTRKQLAP